MTSGTPVVNEMGENNLSLTIEIVQGDEYVLTVALTPMAALLLHLSVNRSKVGLPVRRKGRWNLV
jgi:hypothetical protein